MRCKGLKREGDSGFQTERKHGPMVCKCPQENPGLWLRHVCSGLLEAFAQVIRLRGSQSTPLMATAPAAPCRHSQSLHTHTHMHQYKPSQDDAICCRPKVGTGRSFNPCLVRGHLTPPARLWGRTPCSPCCCCGAGHISVIYLYKPCFVRVQLCPAPLWQLTLPDPQSAWLIGGSANSVQDSGQRHLQHKEPVLRCM